MRWRHLLLLGYPMLAYAIRDFVKHGLHPDDRKV
jgi:Sec-independent protein secretion pathway component TatC